LKSSQAFAESLADALSSLNETVRRRKWAASFLLLLITSSTLIFSFVEKHSLFDSFYWTITVLSTVGFGDITPHTSIGKTLFIFVAFSGINTYIYLITSWQSSLVEARLEKKLWKLTESVNENSKSKGNR
jgi:voltage-gated potassium channel